MRILVTGGAGYIGSHTVLTLINAGYEVVIFDNFSNSDYSVIQRLEKIVGKSISCVRGDLLDISLIEGVLTEYKINSVIHFAGLKAVGESVANPLEYYLNNVQGSLNLLRAMNGLAIKRLIFSSSATVYGEPTYLPIDEGHPLGPTSPYGRTKLHAEEMMKDLASSDASWSIICLRYFNPIGAHETGLIGEEPNGIPNNLMPYLLRVAEGAASHLTIFGSDYPTKDGTGMRDYIHVMDLAKGHLAALHHISSSSGWSVFNLGTGQAYSVLELVEAFESVNAVKIPYIFGGRRPGDVTSCFANAELAEHILGWRSERGLREMCLSSWRWKTGRSELDLG